MLGVAFLAGTLVFTDTIKRTFDDLFADIYDDTDAYVRSATEQSSSSSAATQRGRIPRVGRRDRRRGRRRRRRRRASSQGFAQIVDADGDAIGNPGQGAPTFGMSYVAGG